MQKLISRTKNGSECSTPLSTQSHDVYVSKAIKLFQLRYIFYILFMYLEDL
jgi:hypothetical protein